MGKVFLFSDGVNIKGFEEQFMKQNPANADCEYPNVEDQSGEKFYYDASKVVEFSMIG